jgi:cysteinyl-tRNA synthetase
MDLSLYNTLSRKAEPLALETKGKARVYLCGPTPYDLPHAGHARSAVVFDVLVRTLRAQGLAVDYVRNVTDVEDKILKRAKENGESPLDLARRMMDVYHEDMGALGCARPDHEPRVSDHLKEIVELIESLVERGAAYAADMPGGTRDVYFAVRNFEGYGKLSRRKIDDLVSGARVEADETNKHDPLDFALWKGAPEGEWGWPSPWGHGRPGWHIECSAMSEKYLGHGFEIHGGGMDLIFPHHENEIAQSEAAHPGQGPFARSWVHHGFVNVDAEKMSKSLGNFVTVRDVLSRNDPEALRLFLIGVHYRGPIQFETETMPGGRVVFPGVDEAERRVDYFYATFERLETLMNTKATAPAKLPKELSDARHAATGAADRAVAALADDLNTPVALAELGEIAKLANEVADLALRRQKEASYMGAVTVVMQGVDAAMTRVTERLGVFSTPREVYRERTSTRRLAIRGLRRQDVDDHVSARLEARKAKDFSSADAIRDELAKQGIALHDGPSGTTWTIAV